MANKPKPAGKFKPTPPPANELSVPEELREAQKAYLLLQLFDADGRTLTKGDANKFRDSIKKSLGFKSAAVANYRRERLADLKLLQITPGRSVTYTLLPDGVDYLAACNRHLDHIELRIKGKTLNTLVAAARDSSFSPEASPSPVTHAPAPRPAAELADAVMSAFEELRGERHGSSGLVPIHEVRQSIADKFGQASARHDVLDEVILNLWREKRIGLEGISDLTRVTEQQLNDGIPGEGNTIFYLEVPSERSALV